MAANVELSCFNGARAARKVSQVHRGWCRVMGQYTQDVASSLEFLKEPA